MEDYSSSRDHRKCRSVCLVRRGISGEGGPEESTGKDVSVDMVG